MDCIVELFSDRPVPETVKRGLKYIAVLLVSLLLYYLIWRLLLTWGGVAAKAYKGMDTTPGFIDYIRALPVAFAYCVGYASVVNFQGNAYVWIQTAVLVLLVVYFVRLIVLKKAGKERLRLCLMICGALMLPLALNLITVIIAGRTRMDTLTVYSFVLFYILALKFGEMLAKHLLKLPSAASRLWRAPVVCTCLLCGLLLWNNFCVSNAFYLELQLRYENAYALANRIVMRIEQLDEYGPEVPVLFMGEPEDQYDLGVDFSPLAHMRTANQLMGSHPNTFIRSFTGLTLPGASSEQAAAMRESGFVDAMPSYPARDSVQYHDGLILVKLGDGDIY